jgi:hypothetical protein
VRADFEGRSHFWGTFMRRSKSIGTRLLSAASFMLVAGLLGGAAGVSGQDTGSGQPQSAPTMTIQANVRRVVVDVVVTDAKGHPVKGLSRDDFQLFEDGAAQRTRSFDVHEMSPVAESTLPDRIALPPNTFVNLVRAPKDAPVTVILYDVLNTPATALPYAHEAMVKFIKSQKGGSRFAIFVLGSQLQMLQGFTDDETRLMAALNSKKARTQQSSLLMTDTTSGDDRQCLCADCAFRFGLAGAQERALDVGFVSYSGSAGLRRCRCRHTE